MAWLLHFEGQSWVMAIVSLTTISPIRKRFRGTIFNSQEPKFGCCAKQVDQNMTLRLFQSQPVAYIHQGQHSTPLPKLPLTSLYLPETQTCHPTHHSTLSQSPLPIHMPYDSCLPLPYNISLDSILINSLVFVCNSATSS